MFSVIRQPVQVPCNAINLDKVAYVASIVVYFERCDAHNQGTLLTASWYRRGYRNRFVVVVGDGVLPFRQLLNKLGQT